jgi:hypothetical protein
VLEEKRDAMQATAEREKQQKAHTAETKTELNRERQQRYHDRQNLLHGGNNAKKAVLGVSDLQAPPTLSSDLNVAEVSRPEGLEWKKKRTGVNNGVIQKRNEQVNWYHPFLWNSIANFAPWVAWSPTQLVRILQRQSPMYAGLNRGTVSKWIDGRSWSAKTLQNVERRHQLAGTERVGVLLPYPALVESIKTKLTEI